MKRLALALVCWLTPALLLAHHPVTENGIAAAEPTAKAEANLTFARFDFEGVASGSWRALTMRAEYPVLSRLSVGGSVPFVHLERDYGPDVLGAGDTDIYGRFSIFASEHGGLLFTAGLGLGLPTGDVDAGLGSGHFEVSPHIIASSQLGEHFIAVASVVQRSSLTSERVTGPWHGAIVAPHQPHELDATAAGATLFGPLYVKADIAATFDWSRRVSAPVRTGLELGWFRARRWRVSLRADVPIAGQRRTDFTSTLSAQFIP